MPLPPEPADSAPRRSRCHQKPRILTADQQHRLESTALQNSYRSGALITLLTRTGARPTEACALTTDDIDLTAATVYLHGSNADRTVPLPEPALTRMAAWLDRRRPGPGPLWGGYQLHLPELGGIVAATARTARVDLTGTHQLRHTYRQRLIDDGVPPERIGELLGVRAAAREAS